MKRYNVTLTGETPLLHHHDNLEWASVMRKWMTDPGNKKASVAGDDRSPAFGWIGALYYRGKEVVVPSDNIMTMLREGGAKCPTGKGQETFKRHTQSGIIVDDPEWPIVDPRTGEIYSASGLEEIMDEMDFAVHEQWAIDKGFVLFSKRAKVGQNKHVRVRPRFDHWVIQGSVTVLEPKITTDVLSNILKFAGTYSGIGDWRPSSPKAPGPFGRFSADVEAM